ncbi:MAG TPA: hypothetical protein VG273_16585 [Bryobacteraceae bacterium]|jgi:hypothetical protein|nr:hypothetical protein [Bryobacteraceae bacterium]
MPTTYSVADLAPQSGAGTYSVDDIASVKPSAQLPAPDDADRITTDTGRRVAEILTRPQPAQITAAPTPASPAPQDPGVASMKDAFENHPFLTGIRAATNVPVIGGIEQAVEGLLKIAHPASPREMASGGSQLIGGALDAAAPGLPGQIAKAPLRTAATLAAGAVSQAAVEKGLKKIGLPGEYAQFAGDLAGLIAGAGAHSISDKAATAIKAKYGPVLEARAAKTKAPEPTANSTGTQIYRPSDIEETTNADTKKPAQAQSAPEPQSVSPAGPVAPAGPEHSGGPQRSPEGTPAATEHAPAVGASTPFAETRDNRTAAEETPDGRPDGRENLDARGAREGQTVHGAPAPGAGFGAGEATDVLVPGERRTIPARYGVRELADVRTSHVGETFAPNPDYQLHNERDYSKPENQQRVITNSSEEHFNPRYHITDNPDLSNGPPLVDEIGNAIGGNSRGMILQRVYGRGGAAAASYRALLEKKASQFGIDPELVRAMKQPILVRAASHDALETLPGGKQWAVRKTNVSGTAALSSSERAAADAGQMTPEMMAHIGGAIDAQSPDATLNDALTGSGGTSIVNRLISEGFFNEQERPALMDGKTGALTQLAKDRISKALLGKFFRDSDQIARTPASIKAKLERIAAPLARVAGNLDWDLTPNVQEAVDLLEYAGAHGIRNLADVVAQKGMFGDSPAWSNRAIAIAGLLRDAKPNDVVSAFRKFVNSKEPTMFGESTPGEAFRDAFEPHSSERGGVDPELLTLGAGKFIKHDIAPVLKDTAEGLRAAANDLIVAFAPSLSSPSAAKGGAIMRMNIARMVRANDQAEYAMRQASRYFRTRPEEENFAFIDRMERGEKQPDQHLQSIADSLREVLDTGRQRVQELGNGALEKWIENYFPHIWEKPERAQTVWQAFFARRPLEGSKSFLKKRTIPTIAEGRGQGLTPATDNPVDLALLKLREMYKYVMAHETLDDWKRAKLARYVDAREGKAPAGWGKISDPIGTVYGQSIQQIAEFPNEGIWNGLTAVADALGIKHERGFANLRGAVGRASPSGWVKTMHGSAEQVLAHEIGHQIDWLAGSGRKFVLEYPDEQTVKRLKRAYATVKDTKGTSIEQRRAAREELDSLKDAIADRKEFARQLRALADLRAGDPSYTHKREEKMAQLAEMWVGAREQFERTAPTVYAKWKQFLDENPKLQALRDIEGRTSLTSQQSPYDVGGLVIRGNYYAPEGAARILNNYLSPGLRSRSGIFRGVLTLNNVLNQFQLGLSAFHLGFTAADTTVSKVAMGYQALMRGKPLEAAKHFIAAPAAPFTTAIQGDKLLREWYKPGSQGAAIGGIVDDLVIAGGRARMDQMYRTQAGEHLTMALRRGNLIGALLRAPFAGVEWTSNLLMDELVPRMKLGAFADMARFHMSMLPDDATFEDGQRLLIQDWNSIENRLGEMTYDNLFWDRTIKDLAMIMTRSVGWNLGTLREIGGGLGDLAVQPLNALRGKPVNLNRLSYLLALVTVSAVASSVYQYLKTGKRPAELEDYFFPRNGEVDEQGRPQRVSLPTYVKDVYHYATEPAKTVEGKVAPIWTSFAEMIHNRDFLGNEIRNPDDPLVKQLAELTKAVAEQAVPIGVRNYQRERDLGASASSRAEQFVGITPAPAALAEGPGERLARDISAADASGAARTPVEAERRELRQKLARSLRMKTGVPKDVIDARKAGKLSKRDVDDAVRASKVTPLQGEVEHLGLEDALRVWNAADARERKQLRPILLKKARGAAKTMPPAQWQADFAKVRSALAE